MEGGCATSDRRTVDGGQSPPSNIRPRSALFLLVATLISMELDWDPFKNPAPSVAELGTMYDALSTSYFNLLTKFETDGAGTATCEKLTVSMVYMYMYM